MAVAINICLSRSQKEGPGPIKLRRRLLFIEKKNYEQEPAPQESNDHNEKNVQVMTKLV